MTSVHVNHLKAAKPVPLDIDRDPALRDDIPALSPDKTLFKLAQKLQTSLMLDNVLEIFYHTAIELKQINHLSFHLAEKGIDKAFGKAARHQCNYNLTIENEDLGTISFTRRVKFTDEDQSTLENLLCLLVYPLRNAVIYQEAINAAVRDPLTGVCRWTSPSVMTVTLLC